MKNLFILLFLALTGFLLTSCFEISTTIKIKKDGSGTIVSKMLVNPAAPNAMGGEAKAVTFPSEKELVAKAKDFGEGVKFISVEKAKNKAGWEGFIATYGFDDVSTVKLNTQEGMSDMGDKVGKDSDPKFITFSIQGKELSIKTPFELLEGEPTAQDEAAARKAAMGIALVNPMVKDATWKINVETEGEIVNTNAKFQDGNKIDLMSMDIEKMVAIPDVFRKLNSLEYSQTRDETVKVIKGLNIDFQEVIKVEFK